MNAKILSGKHLALKLKQDVVKTIKDNHITPCLAVCLVGNDPASLLYVDNKKKACAETGIANLYSRLPADASTDSLLSLIQSWNLDPAIHGILVQLPLPSHIDAYKIINSISPQKDVDGFHALNIGNIAHNHPLFLPCTPSAIKHILLENEIKIKGKNITIINHSIVVGQPLALMLLQEKGTVTVCHEHTTKENLEFITRNSDIIITAVGKRPKFSLKANMIKKDAVVIDVGVNRLNGKTIGDVDFDDACHVASAITPAIGAIGPLTISFLLKNTVKATLNQTNNNI